MKCNINTHSLALLGQREFSPVWREEQTHTQSLSLTHRHTVQTGCPCRRGNDPVALSLTCAPALPWGPECQLTHHRAFSFHSLPFFFSSLLYLWRVPALLALQRRPRSWQGTGFSLSLPFPLSSVPSLSLSYSLLLNWVVWQTGLSTRRHSVGSLCVCIDTHSVCEMLFVLH